MAGGLLYWCNTPFVIISWFNVETRESDPYDVRTYVHERMEAIAKTAIFHIMIC